MMPMRALTTLLAGGFLLGVSAFVTTQAQPNTADTKSAAVDAYVYGYPLVTMELTRRNFTNVVKPDGKNAPMGVFVNVPKYPPASDKRVTAPNADTLYSTAWIDVGKEPYILHVPAEDGRYYLMPMLSGWTTCLPIPVSAQPAPTPQISQSPARVGREHSRPASRLNTKHPLASFGC